jgi:cation transport ATPase
MDDLISSEQKDEEDSGKVEHLVPLREQLRKALSSKQSLSFKSSGKEKNGCSLGSILDIINFILNVLLAAFYIASTYKPHELAKQTIQNGEWYAILLLLAHIFFLLEFMIRVYAAEDFRKFILTMENIVNIITIFPFLIITYTINDTTSRWRFFVRMLDLLRILVLLRVT